MATARIHGFQALLTPDGYNPKLKKGRAAGYATAVMHFAPAKLGGFEVCAFRSPGCSESCLNTAGHGGIIRKGETTNAIQLARLARKNLFFRDRATFNSVFVDEVETHIRRSTRRGMVPAVRPNGTSDLPWERLSVDAEGRTILDRFPAIQFYDYTKNPKRALANARGEHPANYLLVFSRSETNEADCLAVLAAGGNVAVVFAGPRPATYLGYPVIDGDHDDLRFKDPRGVVVGLTAKGRGKRDRSGFVVRAA